MNRPVWLRDSISRRFAVSIASCAAVCLLLNVLADGLVGGPAFQPPSEASLLERLPTIIHTMDVSSSDRRAALAEAARSRNLSVDWYSAERQPGGAGAPITLGLLSGSEQSGSTQKFQGNKVAGPIATLLVAALQDGSSVVFRFRKPGWSPEQPTQWVVRVAILVFSILIVSLAGASRLSRPIAAFASAARRFGSEPNAPPMPKQGPEELQVAIAAFNAMQSQVQRLLLGQAAMFAAISHDLRTPLTRIRLRGEFIEDRDQQDRLFRDVDEMQAMVTAVLTFLRDQASDEGTTNLDLAELLRSIIDDQADLGHVVSYTGPGHLAFPGRPIGLRRAFGNLLDNAVKYAANPTIALQRGRADVTVTITDQGPGIAPGELEAVFEPFRRLDMCRSPHTGGTGLGLTSARAIFRAHGGDVSLSNAQGGGLRATVILPVPADLGVKADASS